MWRTCKSLIRRNDSLVFQERIIAPKSPYLHRLTRDVGNLFFAGYIYGHESDILSRFTPSRFYYELDIYLFLLFNYLQLLKNNSFIIK